MGTSYSLVLIETYWNVKTHTDRIFCQMLSVLIETYWSVKAIQESAKNALESGINRNILECKVKCPDSPVGCTNSY